METASNNWPQFCSDTPPCDCIPAGTNVNKGSMSKEYAGLPVPITDAYHDPTDFMRTQPRPGMDAPLLDQGRPLYWKVDCGAEGAPSVVKFQVHRIRVQLRDGTHRTFLLGKQWGGAEQRWSDIPGRAMPIAADGSPATAAGATSKVCFLAARPASDLGGTGMRKVVLLLAR